MLTWRHLLSSARHTKTKAWKSLNSCLPHPSPSLVLKGEWGYPLQEDTDNIISFGACLKKKPEVVNLSS